MDMIKRDDGDPQMCLQLNVIKVHIQKQPAHFAWTQLALCSLNVLHSVL